MQSNVGDKSSNNNYAIWLLSRDFNIESMIMMSAMDYRHVGLHDIDYCLIYRL